MGTRQIDTIETGIRTANKGITSPDDKPKLCCTLETKNSLGNDVWIQVFAGTVNSMYPFGDEPMQRLRSIGVNAPSGIILIEWEASSFATFGVESVSTRDQAAFVDQLFVRLLGCIEGAYDLDSTIEDLE